MDGMGTVDYIDQSTEALEHYFKNEFTLVQNQFYLEDLHLKLIYLVL